MGKEKSSVGRFWWSQAWGRGWDSEINLSAKHYIQFMNEIIQII
jgi:hypothetical protein